jgi:hypothetical protein
VQSQLPGDCLRPEADIVARLYGAPVKVDGLAPGIA